MILIYNIIINIRFNIIRNRVKPFGTQDHGDYRGQWSRETQYKVENSIIDN